MKNIKQLVKASIGNIRPPSINSPPQKRARTDNGITQPSTSGTSVPTQNRYDALADLEGREQPAAAASKQRAPAPVIIPGKPANIISQLSEMCKKPFTLKYTKNNTNIYTTDSEDKRRLLAVLKNAEREYYTYTKKSDKTNAFVLRGLDADISVEEIEEELKAKCVGIIKVFKMITQRRPLYVVTTTNQMTINDLNNNIKVVYYTRITWERVNNKKQIIDGKLQHAGTLPEMRPDALNKRVQTGTGRCSNMCKLQ